MQAARMSRKEAARWLSYFVGEEIADDFAQPAIIHKKYHSTDDNCYKYIAENFFPTVRALVGYFEMVT